MRFECREVIGRRAELIAKGERLGQTFSALCEDDSYLTADGDHKLFEELVERWCEANFSDDREAYAVVSAQALLHPPYGLLSCPPDERTARRRKAHQASEDYYTVNWLDKLDELEASDRETAGAA